MQTYNRPQGSTSVKDNLLTNVDLSLEAIRSSFSGASSPTNPTPIEGQLWWDEANNKLCVYDGSAWNGLLLGTMRWVDIASYSSLAAAITAIGSTPTTLILATVINASNSTEAVTVPATLSLFPMRGGMIAKGSATSLTINSAPVGNPMHQWLSGFAEGEVLFGSVVRWVYPEYWGVDGVADNAQINSAILSLVPHGGKVLLLPKTYKIAATIYHKSYVSMGGIFGEIPHSGVVNTGGSVLEWAGGSSGYMMVGINIRQCTISGFGLDGKSNTALNGILYDSTDGSSAECIFERFSIRDCYIGVQWGTSDLTGSWAAQGWFRTFTIWSSVAGSVGFVLNSGNVGQQCEISHGGIQTRHIGIDAQYSNMMTIRRVFGGARMGGAFIQIGYANGMLIDSCSSEAWGSISAVDAIHSDAYFMRIYPTPQGAASTEKLTIIMMNNTINNPILIELGSTQRYRIVSIGDMWGSCKDPYTEEYKYATGTCIAGIAAIVAINNGIWVNAYDTVTGLPTQGWIDSEFVSLTNMDELHGWIVPAFNSVYWGANLGGSWVLQGSDVETFRYFIQNKTMTVSFKVGTTTIEGEPTLLAITIPGGKISKAGTISTCRISNNSIATIGTCGVGAGGTQIEIQKVDYSAFVEEINTTSIQGQITFEIQ